MDLACSPLTSQAQGGGSVRIAGASVITVAWRQYEPSVQVSSIVWELSPNYTPNNSAAFVLTANADQPAVTNSGGANFSRPRYAKRAANVMHGMCARYERTAFRPIEVWADGGKLTPTIADDKTIGGTFGDQPLFLLCRNLAGSYPAAGTLISSQPRIWPVGLTDAQCAAASQVF